jgi:hypothetical protein
MPSAYIIICIKVFAYLEPPMQTSDVGMIEAILPAISLLLGSRLFFKVQMVS